MFKRLALILVLVLALVAPALACTLSTGSNIWIFTGPRGQMEKYTSTKDQAVTFHAIQPSIANLRELNALTHVTEDWTNGKVVTDASGTNMLAHETDLKCDDDTEVKQEMPNVVEE
jgi:hypothetical protein